MYMLACRSYRLQQCGEELVAVGVELHLVVLERKGKTLVGEELYERTIVVGQRQLALLHKLQHRPLRQLVKRSLRYKRHLTSVTAEEHVKYYSNNGHKE